jgi:hypothetical protein
VLVSTSPTYAAGSSRSSMMPSECRGVKIAVASWPAARKMGAVPPGWISAN